jgi:copper transport protein
LSPLAGFFRTITVVVALLSLPWIPQAAAHAVLLERYPAENASLSSAPDEVRLRFNEVVSPISVRVLDASGQSVTGSEDVSEADETVRVRLPQGLQVGSYVVTYRVISADSHPVGGSFVFAIGPAAPDAALTARVAGTSDGAAWTAIAAAMRALFYAAFLLGAGGSLFLVFVDRQSPAARADRRDSLAACIAAAILLAISLGVEGASAAAAPLSGLLDPKVWRIGLHTTMGDSAVVTLLGLAALVLGLARHGSRTASFVMAAGAILAAAGFALTGHAAMAEPRWLTAPVLALHVLCAAYWAGALVPLYRRLRTEPGRSVAPVVARFSRLALYIVPVLLAGGLLLACVQVLTPAALIGTAYGQRLLAKLALVAGLLLLATLNKLRLTPALARGAPGATRLLRGSIAAELALIAGILVATAMLGQATPPRALAEETHAHHHPEIPAEDFTVTAMAGNRKLLLEVAPAHPGNNRLTMTLTNQDGTPMAALEVSVWLSSPALGIEPSELKATQLAPGRYVAAAAPLPVAGAWAIEIDALVTDFEKAVFTTTVTIQ